MDNGIYVNLGRLEGLRAEMRVVANNIANVSTTGFKREGVIFSEYISAHEDRNSSLSMAIAELQRSDFTQGPLSETGAPLDFAIDGDGFFLIENEGAQMLTRAGAFTINLNGEVVTPSGNRLLDAGGAPVLVPPDASQIKLSTDGTLSADGRPIAEIGLFRPAQDDAPQRMGEAIFSVEEPPIPVENPSILQGFREDSNVNAILEVARMIEVHRSYERSANLNKAEDERIKSVLQTLAPV